MLNIRNIAIFGFLVAAVLVSTSSGVHVDQQAFERFILLAANYDKDPLCKYQTEHLDKVEDVFKNRCLKEFNESLATEKKNWPSRVPNQSFLAYHAFRDACKEYVDEILDTLPLAKRKCEIVWQFQLMLEQKNIIQFFVNKRKISEDKTKMKTESQRVMEEYKNEKMTQDEAKLWVVLHSYDEGILGDHYPEEKPKNAASTSVTTKRGFYSGERSKNRKSKPGDYVPIMDRFDNFKTLVRKITELSNLNRLLELSKPSGTLEYQTDLLDEVEHNFKLRCLKTFETERCPEQCGKNTWEHAYIVLDKESRSYVEEMEHKLKTDRKPWNAISDMRVFSHSLRVPKIPKHYLNIDWQLNSMLNNGNIMEFFVHKNKESKNKKEMKTEMDRLRKIYPNMEDDEAELWFILHKYDEGILGDHYPKENAASTSVATKSGSFSEKKPRNADSKPGAYVPIQKRFENFIKMVKEVASGPLPVATFEYKEIDHLNEVEHDFKLQCLKELGSRNTPNDAYKALHSVCQSYCYEMIHTIKNNKYGIGDHLYSMLKDGNIIQFFVHENKANIGEKEMKKEIDLLRKTYQNMRPDEGELWVILHDYDEGILGDHYTGARPGSTSKTQGAYVPIKKRYDDFKTLLKKVANSKAWAGKKFKYEINLLDGVEHDFKFRCLKEFENRLDKEKRESPAQVEDNKPKFAYEVLNGASRNYVEEIGWTLKVADKLSIYRNIKSFLDKMSEEGNIIQFFADKNKANKNTKEMKTEIERVAQALKNEKMSTEEAKIWVIVHTYNKEIIGDHYPKRGRLPNFFHK